MPQSSMDMWFCVCDEAQRQMKLKNKIDYFEIRYGVEFNDKSPFQNASATLA